MVRRLRLASVIDAAARLGSAPIVTVNLWFDRPVMNERQVGLIGTAFHWVFAIRLEAGRLVSSSPAAPRPAASEQ